MDYPVINWQQQINGLDLFWDALDFNVRFYAPKLHWQPLQINQLGNQVTVVSGEISLDLTSAERQALQIGNPSLRFSPLFPSVSDIKISSSVNVITPHTISLNIIQNMPFPKVILNATIKHIDPNYQSIIDEIQQAWVAQALLLGKLSFGFSMSLIDAAYKVYLLRNEVYSSLAAALGSESGLTAKAIAATHTVVSQSFDKWWTIIGPPPPAGALVHGNENAEAYLTDFIFQSWFQEAPPAIIFDGNRPVRKWNLRSRLEMVDELSFDLLHSSPKVLNLNLLN